MSLREYAHIGFKYSRAMRVSTPLARSMIQESGLIEIYVAAFPTFAVKRKVSTGGGDYPVWAKGGKEILCLAAGGRPSRGSPAGRNRGHRLKRQDW